MIGILIWCGMVAAPALIWLLFRRGGYKRLPLDAPPGPDWTMTGERFVDPTSGETLEVWQAPKSGERAYVRMRSSSRAGQTRPPLL
jgi:hypothetical protein